MPNCASSRIVVRGPENRVLELGDAIRGKANYPPFPPSDEGEAKELEADIALLSGHAKLEALKKGAAMARAAGIDIARDRNPFLNIWLTAIGGEGRGGCEEDPVSLNRIAAAPLELAYRKNDSALHVWRTENWGSKSYQCDYVADETQDGVFCRTYYLTTAWSPVTAPIIELIEMFSDLDIAYVWAEIGNNEGGIAFRDSRNEIQIISEGCDVAIADLQKHNPDFEDVECDEISDTDVMDWYYIEYVENR